MVNPRDLCRECGSTSFLEGPLDSGAGKAGMLVGQGLFSTGELRAFVCTDCGYLSVFVPLAIREKLAKSKHWVEHGPRRARKSS